MNKKEEFKNFVKNHPELLNYVKEHKMTWQDFYEIYDIYGDSDETWNKYFQNNDRDSNIKLTELAGMLKNINFDNIEHHINNAQKAISIIQELTKKNPTPEVTPITTPIENFYGD